MTPDSSEEHIMLRNLARQFAINSIQPVAGDDDHSEHFPREIVGEMSGPGFLGALVPQEYGGSGLDWLGYAIITEEVACASMSIAASVFCSHALVGEALAAWGSEGQKQQYLPALSGGGMLGCHTVDESDTGIDIGSVRARYGNGQWAIDGDKGYVINGGIADLGLVFARTEEGEGYPGIAAFLVGRDAAGFSGEEAPDNAGLRSASIANACLRNCRITRENLLGSVGDGEKIARSLLDGLHFAVAASCVGAAQACCQASIKYAQERQAFGEPIANFGMIQDMIADMIVDTETAKLLTYQVAGMRDERQPFRRQLAMARYFTSRAALRTVRDAIQVHGGYGYDKRSLVERYFRDVNQIILYGGSPLLHKLAAARSSLGINPA